MALSTQRSLLVVGAANTQRLVALLPVTVDTVLSTRGRRRKTRRAAQMPALPAPSPPAVSCPLDPLDAGKAAKKRYTKPLDGSRSSQKQPYGVVPVAAIGSSMYSLRPSVLGTNVIFLSLCFLRVVGKLLCRCDW